MADDEPLPPDGGALAALRRDLAAYTRALTRALKAERAFTAEAEAASQRAWKCLRRSGEETGFRAVIAMLMAAESVHELAALARPAAPAPRPVHPPVIMPGGTR
ncbi:hypothetical protein AB0G74_08610 [Streptomyces sp. NPDC020875]|uniref:hypothetical protein n=1 Tax=Streptomyces sp. NPDC020875 TaxID=3154898 RepID=UPI003403F393